MRRRDLRVHIARWRENVLDLDLVVDDKREAERIAFSERRDAERDRDRAVVHLAHLIELH
nr:MetaGeneMark_Unknown Function [uncultured bacterium]